MDEPSQRKSPLTIAVATSVIINDVETVSVSLTSSWEETSKVFNQHVCRVVHVNCLFCNDTLAPEGFECALYVFSLVI